MRRQLAFEFRLLKLKKKWFWMLLFGNGIYILLNIIWMERFLEGAIVSSVIISIFNMLSVMSILCSNVSNDNQSRANYTMTRYYPTKRVYYYYSKFLIAVAIWIVLSIEVFVTYTLSTMINKSSMDMNLMIITLLGVFIASVLCSCMTLLTSFSGKANQVGLIILCTLVGMVCGGFSGYISDGELVISWKVISVIVIAVLSIWAISLYIALVLAKKCAS